MSDEVYNWYEEGEEELGEFTPKENVYTAFHFLFDKIYDLAYYLFIICGIIWVFRYLYVLKTGQLWKYKVDLILFLLAVYSGSFISISILVNFISLILKQFCGIPLRRHLENTNKAVRLALWLGVNYYLVQFVKDKVGVYYFGIRSFLLCGYITFITFVVLEIILEKFYLYFLKESLQDKINDVEMRERILASMKSYRYELSEISSLETRSVNDCCDIFFGNNEDYSIHDEASHIDLFEKSGDREIGVLLLKKPEIYNEFDAKTLAKEVFQKASSDGKILSFQDFSSMFPNAQIAFQAFAFFDTNDQKEVTKKEFRDTIINFFSERLNLEKNVTIAENFVKIVRNIAYISSFIFLILAYLMIFGISISDLLAFAVSSALVLNFLVSGVATELFADFQFVLSHSFDIGDDIVVDDIDYKVYEIGLTSTSFLCRNGGKITFLNGDLWKRKIINMTRAPEKKILFLFSMNPDTSTDQFKLLQQKISAYVIEHWFDYHHKFKIESISEHDNSIEILRCSLVLKCRGYKTRAKKFFMRLEFSKFLRDTLKDLEIQTTSAK